MRRASSNYIVNFIIINNINPPIGLLLLTAISRMIIHFTDNYSFHKQASISQNTHAIVV